MLLLLLLLVLLRLLLLLLLQLLLRLARTDVHPSFTQVREEIALRTAAVGSIKAGDTVLVFEQVRTSHTAMYSCHDTVL